MSSLRAVRRGSLLVLSSLALAALAGSPAGAARDGKRIEAELVSTGADGDASGDARLRTRRGRKDFNVEVEDLDPARYDLVVGGAVRAVLDVVEIAPGVTEGEVEFAKPGDSGKLPLDFDPRGKLVSVERAGTVYLHVVFPRKRGAAARRSGGDDSPGDVRREDRQDDRREDRQDDRREDRRQD